MQALQFNVAQLLKEPSGATRHYQIDDDITELGTEFVSSLKGAVKFTRTADGVLVTGHLSTSAVLTCRRCLEDFISPVEIDLEEEFRAGYDVFTGIKLPAREDDEAETMIDEHHTLDLSEVLRQDLLLALTPFPLCREDCAGLCPHCGKNLNEGPCDCAADSLDPRWAALQELLFKGA